MNGDKTYKLLSTISGKYGFQNIFDDFTQMVVCAYSMGRMEEQYLKIAKKYEPKELEVFANALGEMVLEYESASLDGNWDDVIGNIYEMSGSSNAKTGQFFTPKSICDLMANFCNHQGEYVNDPSAGSSRNLVAHSRQNPNNRFTSFYVAQDLDNRCINMSVINFIMYGMKGVVIHCDTLSMKVFKGYRIYLPETGLFVVPLNENEALSYLIGKKTTEIEEPKTEEPIKKAVQLELF
jgi:type I restriction-modification system DNA methylase subunit